MNLHAWAEQRAKYSRAKHGRDERGASLVECALITAVAQAKGLQNAHWAGPRVLAGVGAVPASEAAGGDRRAAA